MRVRKDRRVAQLLRKTKTTIWLKHTSINQNIKTTCLLLLCFWCLALGGWQQILWVLWVFGWGVRGRGLFWCIRNLLWGDLMWAQHHKLFVIFLKPFLSSFCFVLRCIVLLREYTTASGRCAGFAELLVGCMCQSDIHMNGSTLRFPSRTLHDDEMTTCQ